jgi:hypothetical protein
MKKTTRKTAAKKRVSTKASTRKNVGKKSTARKTTRKAVTKKTTSRRVKAKKTAARRSTTPETAKTVDSYLASLPADRREVLSALRTMIHQHLPSGYREAYNWGMISYEVPLERYPNTPNGQPLSYLALAAQKNHFALYMLGAYPASSERKTLEQAFTESGKKLDMGKSCLRFRRLDDLPLAAVGQVIASTPVDAFISRVDAIWSKRSQE